MGAGTIHLALSHHGWPRAWSDPQNAGRFEAGTFHTNALRDNVPTMRRSLVLLFAVASVAAAQQIVQFKEQIVDANMTGGYAVGVIDINHDGKPDIVGISQQVKDLVWYENPSWTPHLIAKDLPGLVNLAFNDVDHDGIPEIVVEYSFSMQPAKSEGNVVLLSHQGDPTGLWKVNKVDAISTSHHIAWADLEGTGQKLLINAPLISPNQVSPKYEGKVPVYFYRVPKDWSGPWKRELLTDQLGGVTHRVRVVKWDGDSKRDQLLIAGFDGITLFSASGTGANLKFAAKLINPGDQVERANAPGTAYSIGTGDVKIGHLGKQRFLITNEPWHGNEVVVYLDDHKGGWTRQVIFTELTEGHEICIGDLNGDGLDDIVAGDRSRGKVSTSHVFYASDATGTKWHHEELDHLGMSASGCEIADINGDGRPDIIMIGGATHNIKVYENLGVAK